MTFELPSTRMDMRGGYPKPMPPRPPMTYAAAGVDIAAGDRLVDMIGAMVRRTHGPRVLGAHGAFAGMFRLDYNEKLFRRNFKDPVLVACTDGVGTKVKLAAELGVYDTVGIDCVAMNVNDLIVQGAEPLFFLDYLGLHRQDPERTAQIVQGVARGCEIADCALLGGECAEMPDIYAEGDFDIAGFAVGVVELRRAVDPVRVEPGDVVIGVSSSGLHSNGFTLVRQIIERRKLDLERVYPEIGPRTLGEVLLTRPASTSGRWWPCSAATRSSGSSRPWPTSPGVVFRGTSSGPCPTTSTPTSTWNRVRCPRYSISCKSAGGSTSRR